MIQSGSSHGLSSVFVFRGCCRKCVRISPCFPSFYDYTLETCKNQHYSMNPSDALVRACGACKGRWKAGSLDLLL